MVAKAAPAPAAHHEEDEAEPGPRKKSKKGLIIAIAAVVAALALGGGGAAWYFHAKASSDTDEEEEAKPAKTAKAKKGEKDKAGKKGAKDKAAKPAVFLPMEPFTVNLRGDRYLQIGLVIQAEDAMSSDAAKAQMPVIRSQVLLLLAAKSPEELATPEGKDKLAAELLERIRQPVAGPPPLEGLERVHFSAFIIQ